MNVKLTAARGVARPAQVPIDLHVSRCSPDSVTLSIVPATGPVGCQVSFFMIAQGFITYPVWETAVHI